MTRDHRLIVTLDEIRALRWTCGTCGASITFPLDRTIRWPDRCPACHEDAPSDPAAAQADETFRKLIAALQASVRVVRHSPGPSATLSFEFVERVEPGKP